MEHNFNHQEFEEFLQNQIKNHRMYPNDASWLNIKKRLHEEKKWPALTIATITILSLSIFICAYFTSKPNIFIYNPISESSIGAIKLYTKNIAADSHATKIFASQNANGNKHKNLKNNEEIRTVESLALKTTNVQTEKSEISSNETFNSRNAIAYESASNQNEIRNTNQYKYKITENNAANVVASFINSKKSSQYFSSLSKENKSKNNIQNQSKLSLVQQFKANKSTRKGSDKLALQLYFSPSISYRILKEVKPENENIDGPIALNYVTDVNNVVRHKPGTGLEAGLSFMYNMTKTIRLKSGLQFNMRQYSIEAYRSTNEVASITLVNGNNLDTVNSIAMYRTSNGFYSTDLVNRYFQLSVPVGVEWQIAGNKKIQWNVAGSIQPTYLLNKDAYLISTNFKNYTESPDVIRRWNINSNFETFISFKSGGFKWQVGPQIRYQPNSTFISQYPIKEYLLDYGLKVGISTGL